MIEVLNGIKETVIYEGIDGFKLHDNTNFEAYPEHWHTPIEIIMPLKNYYNVSNKTDFLHYRREIFSFSTPAYFTACRPPFTGNV